MNFSLIVIATAAFILAAHIAADKERAKAERPQPAALCWRPDELKKWLGPYEFIPCKWVYRTGTA